MTYIGAVGTISKNISDTPFTRSLEAIAMTASWNAMAAVTLGSDFIRSQASSYLPQEPRETDEAHESRVARSVLSPYTQRIIETAAGAILRKPIHIEGDDYWKKFAENVDGLGSDLNEFARRILVSSLTYGHSAILVDYPPASVALSLAEERALERRQYFVPVEAPQIWGWRQETTLPTSPLTQVRIHEYTTQPQGDFGETQVEQMRVIYPGSYDLYIQGQKSFILHESGKFTLPEIPVVPIYANRLGMLRSQPPLLDIANLNITHYQRQADLIHALHVAAMPILILEGFDMDTNEVSVGVNYALSMTPGNKAYYVQSDASSFAAQAEEIKAIETQMSTLGITKLFGQKFVSESADSKRIDQAQSNSVLAVLSMEVCSGLKRAFEMASQYVGIEPPEIYLDRDFDFYRLIGQDITAITDLNTKGKLSDETLLEILRRGEILPDDLDIEDELERIRGTETEDVEVYENPVEVETQPEEQPEAEKEEALQPNQIDRLISLLSR